MLQYKGAQVAVIGNSCTIVSGNSLDRLIIEYTRSNLRIKYTINCPKIVLNTLLQRNARDLRQKAQC